MIHKFKSGKLLQIPLLILSLILITQDIKSEELTAKEILRKTKEVEEVDASYSIVEQTMTTSGGSERTFTIEGWSKDKNNKQLMEYKEPARVKGVRFLFLDDGNDIYTYFPKTDRVRHLASHMKRQKMMGSDFSYEDITIGNIDRDYNSFILLRTEKEGDVDCYVIEILPSLSGPHYSKMILWVDKHDFVIRRIDYYEDKQLLKRLLVYDVKKIENIPTPMKFSMVNIQEGGKTEMIIQKITYDIQLDDELFTTRNLKKR